MTYEEQKEKVISWLIINNVFDSFIYNLSKYRTGYNPFTKENLNLSLISTTFVWENSKEGWDFWENVNNKYKEFYNNYIMKEEKEKSIKIEVPNGYEIDRENSTFEEIKFKKKEECWRAKEQLCAFPDINNTINGFFIERNSEIREVKNVTHSFPNRNIFFTKKQAKSALAMAQISQIMANDSRFGGSITDDEWNDTNKKKYVILKANNCILRDVYNYLYVFLAFHTKEQRDLFLKENEDLVRDYLMLD